MRFWKKKPAPTLEKLLAKRLREDYETKLIQLTPPIGSKEGRPIFPLSKDLREFIESRGFKL